MEVFEKVVIELLEDLQNDDTGHFNCAVHAGNSKDHGLLDIVLLSCKLEK
jgi:hypothetical protein